MVINTHKHLPYNSLEWSMETPIIWPGVWLISSSSAVPKSCLLACYLCQGAAGNTHQRTYHLSQNQCKITAVIGLEPGVFALGLLLPWFTRTLVYLGLHLPWCLRSSWFFFACLLLNFTEQKEQENVTGSPTWWADLKMFQNIYFLINKVPHCSQCLLESWVVC